MNTRQQQADVVARMRQRLAMALATGASEPDDWRQRRDDEGDVIARREADDRYLERGDSPRTRWAA